MLCVATAFGQTAFEQGLDFYVQGKYDEAAANFQKAVEANASNRQAVLLLGMSFAKNGKPAEALKAFENSALLDYKVYKPEYDKAAKLTKHPGLVGNDTARQHLTQGSVKLAVELGADGKIGYIFPITTLKDGITEASIEAARKIEFEPAEKNGKAIPFVTFIVYHLSYY